MGGIKGHRPPGNCSLELAWHIAKCDRTFLSLLPDHAFLPFPCPLTLCHYFPQNFLWQFIKAPSFQILWEKDFLCPLFPTMDLTKAFLNCLLALFLWDHTEHFPWDLTSSLSPPCLQANRLMHLRTFCISASFLNSFLWWSSSLFPLSHAVLALDRALGPCKASEWGLWDRRQV